MIQEKYYDTINSYFIHILICGNPFQIIGYARKEGNVLRVGVCDSDREYLTFLTGLLRQIPVIHEATIIPYLNPKWFVSDLSLQIEAFDLLIISRHVTGYNGAYIAREASRINPACQVILISQENRILDEDYDIDHLFLLPREHVPLRLITVVERAVKIIRKRNERYFFVQVNREKLYIPSSSVLYMEKMLRKTELVTVCGRISTYQIPGELIEAAQAEDFVQCHRSFHVNLANIYSISASEIKLQNGVTLPIGNTYARNVTERYDQFCSKLFCPL